MVAGTAPEEVVGVVPDDARIPEVASLDTLSLQEIPCTNCAIHRSGSADLKAQSLRELPVRPSHNRVGAGQVGTRRQLRTARRRMTRNPP